MLLKDFIKANSSGDEIRIYDNEQNQIITLYKNYCGKNIADTMNKMFGDATVREFNISGHNDNYNGYNGQYVISVYLN